MARISGITIEIGGDTTQLQSALKGVNSTIKSTQNQLKDVEKLLKLDPHNTELLRQKQQLLGNQIQNTKQKLDTLKEAQAQMDAAGVDKNSEQYMALQREIIDTENSLKRLEQQLAEVSAQAGTAGSGMEKFQAAMQKVSSKADAVAKATAAAAEKTRALSTAAAGALAALLGAGYKAATTADDLNTLAKQTGFTTEELQQMQYAADRIDVPMEAITKAAKKMTKQLINSEDKFTDLGIATRDASGNFRGTSDIFYDTIQALSQIENETERDMIAMELFGMSANELAGIIDDGGEALRGFGKEAKEAGLILDQETLDGLNEVNDEIDKLKAKGAATIAKTGAKALQALTPVLDKVAAGIEKILDFIGNLSPQTLGIIMTVLAITAALSPMLKMISKVSSGVSLLTGGLAELAPAIAGISGPVLAIVAVIAVLTAAFVHLWRNNEEFREKVTATWEGLKAKFSGFAQGIVDRLNALGFNFGSFGEVVRAAWNGLCNYLGPVIETTFSAISTIIGTALDVILGIFDFWKSVFSGDWAGAWNAAKAVFTTVWNGIKTLASTIWQGIKTMAGNIWPGIVDAITNAWNSVTATLATIWNSIKSTAMSIWNGIKGTATSIWNGIVTAITAPFNGIVTTLTTIWENVKNTATTIWEGIKSAVTDPISTAKTLVTGDANGWKSALSASWNGIKSIASSTWGGIKDSISRKFTSAKSAVQTTANNIKSSLSNVWSSVGSDADSKFTELKTSVETKFQTLKTSITSTVSGLKSTLSQQWTAIKSTASSAWNSMKSNASSTWNSIKSTASSAMSSLRSTVSGIASSIKSIFPLNIGNIFSGIRLPHFTLNTTTRTILGKTFEIPTGFNIAWYAKAMDNAMILNGASIFGAMPGRLLGGGEAGREVVVSYDKLSEMMGGNRSGETVINITVNGAQYQDDAALADMVARRVQQAIVRKGAVWA